MRRVTHYRVRPVLHGDVHVSPQVGRVPAEATDEYRGLPAVVLPPLIRSLATEFEQEGKSEREGKAGESAQSLHDNHIEGLTKLEMDIDMLNSGGIIVDSGTTDTYWNRGIADGR